MVRLWMWMVVVAVALLSGGCDHTEDAEEKDPDQETIKAARQLGRLIVKKHPDNDKISAAAYELRSHIEKAVDDQRNSAVICLMPESEGELMYRPYTEWLANPYNGDRIASVGDVYEVNAYPQCEPDKRSHILQFYYVTKILIEHKHVTIRGMKGQPAVETISWEPKKAVDILIDDRGNIHLEKWFDVE